MITVIIVLGKSQTAVRRKRADAAIAHYHSEPNSRILFSGGFGEAERMKKYAIDYAVLECNILVENTSENTFQNLQNSYVLLAALFDINNLKIVVCTSTFHIARAALIATRFFTDASFIHTNEVITEDEFASEGRNTASYIWSICNISNMHEQPLPKPIFVAPLTEQQLPKPIFVAPLTEQQLPKPLYIYKHWSEGQ